LRLCCVFIEDTDCEEHPVHTSNAWSIRPAATADAAQIAEFNRRMALETERKALDPDTVLRGVQRLLAE